VEKSLLFSTPLKRFSETLRERLEASAKDSNVAGFKSVVCYRTGLDVSTFPNPSAEISALMRIFEHLSDQTRSNQHLHYQTQSAVPLRLADKPLNDLVVRTTLEVAAEYNKPGIFPFFFSWPRHNVRF